MTGGVADCLSPRRRCFSLAALVVVRVLVLVRVLAVVCSCPEMIPSATVVIMLSVCLLSHLFCVDVVVRVFFREPRVTCTCRTASTRRR